MSTQRHFQCLSRSDMDLAEDIANRDPAAMRIVIQRNNERLFRIAWGILKNREDAEDAVQSSFIKAFAAIRGFSGKSSLSTWLTRIVINDALACARGAKRRLRLEESPTFVMAEYAEKLMRGSISASPESMIARGQIGQILRGAISQLPAPFRKVFELRQIEELDVAQVAKVLGIPQRR
jgi:RNA polymerase sigma-70 factor, ECF subfamily